MGRGQQEGGLSKGSSREERTGRCHHFLLAGPQGLSMQGSQSWPPPTSHHQWFPGKAQLPWQHPSNYSALQKITHQPTWLELIPAEEQVLPLRSSLNVAKSGKGEVERRVGAHRPQERRHRARDCSREKQAFTDHKCAPRVCKLTEQDPPKGAKGQQGRKTWGPFCSV